MIKYISIFRLVLRCLLVARKENLTGFSTGLTGRSKILDPTGFHLWEVGGRSPPIWFKTSKILANSLFIWAHQWRNTVSISEKTFFFGEHLNLGRKTVSISTEKPIDFLCKTQCIKSFFGQKFGAPPNHFEFLRSWL